MKNKRLIAIGDIHGEINNLENLLAELSIKRGDTVVFLGDYIDRGKNSKEVVETLIKLSKKSNCIFLKGNHEQMLIEAFEKRQNNDIENWLLAGGISTVESYGGFENIFKLHGDFFFFFISYYMTPEFLFVHAGMKPEYPVEKQKEDDLFWIRDEFIYAKINLPQRIIFGHTPFYEPLILPDKIGIDTGLGKIKGAKLTAFICTDKSFISI